MLMDFLSMDYVYDATRTEARGIILGELRKEGISNLEDLQSDFVEQKGDCASTTTDGTNSIRGEFDHHAPLLAYCQAYQPKILKIYSLRNDKTLHVFRFGSPIIKVQSSTFGAPDPTGKGGPRSSDTES
jgi:hypothetical protein